MSLFISCDWGTSTFRLRLVDKDNQQVLAEVTNQQGIAATFEEWKNAGGEPHNARNPDNPPNPADYPFTGHSWGGK